MYVIKYFFSTFNISHKFYVRFTLKELIDNKRCKKLKITRCLLFMLNEKVFTARMTKKEDPFADARYHEKKRSEV